MKKKRGKPTRVPIMTTDEEAEAFLAQDLSNLDYSQFKPVTFEFLPKTEKVNLRIPSSLLSAIKKRAQRAKIPYQRYIRHLLERDLYKE
jgi:predicted DNA binding CopG/RHH family protein